MQLLRRPLLVSAHYLQVPTFVWLFHTSNDRLSQSAMWDILTVAHIPQVKVLGGSWSGLKIRLKAGDTKTMAHMLSKAAHKQ